MASARLKQERPTVSLHCSSDEYSASLKRAVRKSLLAFSLGATLGAQHRADDDGGNVNAKQMIPTPQIAKAPDVPAQVFEQFLAELAGAGVPEEVVMRLRKTLVEDRAFGEMALKKAVLGEEAAS